jgi:hypothetical protein
MSSGYHLFVSAMMPVLKDMKLVGSAWQKCDQEVWNQQALLRNSAKKCPVTLKPKITIVIGSKSSGDRVSWTLSSSPKRALTGYNFYFHEQQPLLMAKLKEYPTQQSRVKAIAASWRAMSETQKTEYSAKAAEQSKIEGRRVPKSKPKTQ